MEDGRVSEAKFTPGPWQVKRWQEDDPIIETGSVYFVGNEHMDICYMARNIVGHEDCSDLDARLIAAAPDLYEELESSISLIRDVYLMLEDGERNEAMRVIEHSGHVRFDAGEPWEDSKALARARGESDE